MSKIFRSDGRLPDLQSTFARRSARGEKWRQAVSKLRRQRFNRSAAVQSDVRDACWRRSRRKLQSRICVLKPHNRSSFNSKTFSKFRARNCHSASRKSARRFATKSIRAISRFARASSSKWSWNIFAARAGDGIARILAGRAAEVLREDRDSARQVARAGQFRTKNALFIQRGHTTSNTIFRLAGRNSKASPIAPITICRSTRKPAANRSNISMRKRSSDLFRTLSSRARVSIAPCWH